MQIKTMQDSYARQLSTMEARFRHIESVLPPHTLAVPTSNRPLQIANTPFIQPPTDQVALQIADTPFIQPPTDPRNLPAHIIKSHPGPQQHLTPHSFTQRSVSSQVRHDRRPAPYRSSYDDRRAFSPSRRHSSSSSNTVGDRRKTPPHQATSAAQHRPPPSAAQHRPPPPVRSFSEYPPGLEPERLNGLHPHRL